MAFLEVYNISKRFGKVNVLNGVDLSLEKGQVMSIIGSSGSGKTTLLRCLNFLETPDLGKILVDGDCIFDSDDKSKKSFSEIREKRLSFGLVFQSFNLFPQYSVMGNLTLAPRLRAREMAKKKKLTLAELKQKYAQIQEKAENILASIGLSDKQNSYPCQLSGGQQQRVSIARALMLDPDILFFDEPTSALDPELTGEVLKVIKKLRDEGRTMIVVTHEMEFAKNVSDKVIFMANGIIEEQGSPDDIFNNPQSEHLKTFLSGINK